MERLNEILHELGISKVKLAKYLGVSRQMIYNYLELDDINKWPKDKKVLLLNLLGIKSGEELKKIKVDTDYILSVESRINTLFENNEKRLKLIQIISSYGDYPRDIVLNKDEQYAIVANQKSNNITTFKRNQSNGRLSIYKEKAIKIEKPSCIVGGKI